jgi:isoleucyl-tRNA synthetase
MSTIKSLAPQIDLPAVEHQILSFWETQEIFKKTISSRDGQPNWTFYEGPPTANGKPGTHHIEARVFKDLFPRYQTMKGKQVIRKAGWDCHGLPVEIAVEKQLGFNGKGDIEKYGIAKFNEQCRVSVQEHVGEFTAMTRRMGFWVDFDEAYWTMSSEYVESVWWSLQQIWKKGLLVQDYRVAPYCPRCGTGLSDHELSQGYETIKDQSVYVRFPATSGKLAELKASLLVWTTTPWTLVSNTAVAVNPKIEYQVIEVTDEDKTERLVVASNLAAILGEDRKVIATLSGAELEHTTYLPPLDLVEIPDAHYIILADYVTVEDGTGLVHQSPAFGAEDFAVCRKYGLPVINPITADGHFLPELEVIGGVFFKDADKVLIKELKAKGLLFKQQQYEHSYPHCWRCHTALMYYAQPSWYIRTTEIKDALLRENANTDWHPETIKTGRYGDWLNNNIDWAISRNRYWGTPLPIWRCENKHEICVGSLAELGQLSGTDLSKSDPHRPFVDDITFKCAQCESNMVRTPEVIDCWFDSGAMPFAQWGYPHKAGSLEKFKASYPADFICEAIDQTRGWFYTLHAIGVMVFDSVAFKNVVSNGLVLDKNGQKMSKRLGNGIDPFSTIEKYGADATRWYMISNAQPWDNLKFDLSGIEEVSRKFFGTLYNTYSFFALYANIDQFKWSSAEVPLEKRPEIDRWVLSELNTLIHLVDTDYATYEPTNATRKIMEFVDENLSNWYVRLCRRRFWKGEMSEDKLAAYQTLYTCLNVVSRLMAPVAPFFADWLYRNLQEGALEKGPESVHLALIPVSDSGIIDHALEERMAYAQRISSLVLSLRKKEKLKVRQPLQKMLIPILNDDFEKQVEGVKDLILAEVNVKEIEYVSGAGNIIQKKVKPDFKSLGKKLGKNMKAVADTLASLSQEDIQQIEKSGSFETNISGEIIQLTREELEIVPVDIPGWLVATDAGLTVALDIQLSDELIAEGMARELVNRIQNIRKSSDFNVTDKIAIQLEALDFVKPAVEKYASYICSETLAEKLDVVEKGDGGEILDLPEGEIWIKVTLS